MESVSLSTCVPHQSFELGAVHILRNTEGGGTSQFITILHRGGLESLLKYYSFARKMEGYNPFSAVNKLNGFQFILFNADL